MAPSFSEGAASPAFVQAEAAAFERHLVAALERHLEVRLLQFQQSFAEAFGAERAERLQLEARVDQRLSDLERLLPFAAASTLQVTARKADDAAKQFQGGGGSSCTSSATASPAALLQSPGSKGLIRDLQSFSRHAKEEPTARICTGEPPMTWPGGALRTVEESDEGSVGTSSVGLTSPSSVALSSDRRGSKSMSDLMANGDGRSGSLRTSADYDASHLDAIQRGVGVLRDSQLKAASIGTGIGQRYDKTEEVVLLDRTIEALPPGAEDDEALRKAKHFTIEARRRRQVEEELAHAAGLVAMGQQMRMLPLERSDELREGALSEALKTARSTVSSATEGSTKEWLMRPRRATDGMIAATEAKGAMECIRPAAAVVAERVHQALERRMSEAETLRPAGNEGRQDSLLQLKRPHSGAAGPPATIGMLPSSMTQRDSPKTLLPLTASALQSLDRDMDTSTVLDLSPSSCSRSAGGAASSIFPALRLDHTS
eukprot:TRINITY_DN123122_c0_g1_i1.p1 TRINITY_DN123122_c0_g1~~TRINITY_DN123122_c0_g1_i1.p1  ORF type:complete len:519 (+),score=98.86 TRINITY_DN123122_c0_g1_i1:99-1559(+)